MKTPSLRFFLALSCLILLTCGCNLTFAGFSTATQAATPSAVSTTGKLAFATATTVPPGGTPSTIGADGAGDPYFPQLGNGGYDVTHYTIDLTVDMTGGSISGATTIDAKTTQALSRFDLDYSGPGITALSVDGQKAAYTRSGGELVITPPSLLSAGQTFTTAVAYSGPPGAGPGARR